MMWFVDGFMKNHYLWKDRSLSRRDFLSLVLPRGRRCQGCGEERRFKGVYCPTCAKRRLQPLPGDNP